MTNLNLILTISANEGIAEVRSKYKAEVSALQAQLRREQLKVQSLEKSLDQKASRHVVFHEFAAVLSLLLISKFFSCYRRKRQRSSPNFVMNSYPMCKRAELGFKCCLLLFFIFMSRVSSCVVNCLSLSMLYCKKVNKKDLLIW